MQLIKSEVFLSDSGLTLAHVKLVSVILNYRYQRSDWIFIVCSTDLVPGE